MVLPAEVEMSTEVLVRRATVNSSIESMTVDVNELHIDKPAIASPPIEFVTENGFCLVRLSDLRPATVDSLSDCDFLVRNPDGHESVAVVAFDERVTAQVQTQRHDPLSDSSLFWLTLAEQQLATYLWENDHFPAGGRLIISRLSGIDLALAAGWLD